MDPRRALGGGGPEGAELGGVSRLEVCAGFDGSDVSDWTAIRVETLEGYQMTPRYGPDERSTWWNPEEFNGKIPRGEVRAAVTDLFGGDGSLRLVRMYCDPRDWHTEIDDWAIELGEEHVIEWDTGGGSARIRQVHEMLTRFVTDLSEGSLTHDGCPQTAVHIGNARKLARPGERYILGKPNEKQKIDLAMASALAHEAACDARRAGWGRSEDGDAYAYVM